MNFTVTHGFDDVMAPKATPAEPKRQVPVCMASEWVGAQGARGGKRVWCSKAKGHDDPLAEIGSRQTDPIHEAVQHVGPVRISYTWRSKR